jgi:putative colanic acid biosynthesis glycosyltransferase
MYKQKEQHQILPDKPCPTISVVTVVFNAESTLENTIKSVLSQSYKNIEFIIIDGGSTDNTLKIIENNHTNITYWVSESDNGIYDAMNKALSIATGEWVIFLGADDIFSSSKTVELVFQEINDLPAEHHLNLAVIFGDAVYSNGKHFYSKMDFLMKAWNRIHHQSAFYKKSLFNDFKFNDSYCVSSDYELNLKIFVDTLAWIKVNEVICICGDEGVSSTCQWDGYRENIQIRHKYIQSSEAMIYDCIIISRFILKKILFSFRKHVLTKPS